MALQDPNIMPSSRLDCPLCLKTPDMGNSGFRLLNVDSMDWRRLYSRFHLRLLREIGHRTSRVVFGAHPFLVVTVQDALAVLQPTPVKGGAPRSRPPANGLGVCSHYEDWCYHW